MSMPGIANPQPAPVAGNLRQRVPCCANCRHFAADARMLEQALPGLKAMSSAYASVRSDDGLCGLHERYLHAGSSCAWIELRTIF
jgi:hypothetical protein